MSEDLPEPINPQIPFADLEPGTIPTGLLSWSGAAWVNTLSIPVPAVIADDAKTPDIPTSATYGNLYKKPGNTGLYWATQGAGEVDLLNSLVSTFYDNTFRILNSTDNTKKFGFDVSNVSAGYTDICIVPNYQSILPAKISNNVMLGNTTYALTSGANNTVFGTGGGSGITVGGANVIAGYLAGADITGGADNVVIGANAQAGASLASNRIVLGSGAIGLANNSLTVGATITAIYAAGLSSSTATDILYYNTGTGQISHSAFSITNIPNTLTTQTILPAITNTYALGSASALWSNIFTNGLRIPTGAINGYVWTSDGTGVGSWQPDGGGSGSVNALYGTANQIFVNGGLGPISGTITLTLPQSIATTSAVQFGSAILTTPLAVSSGGTGVITIPSGQLVVGQDTSATTSIAYSAVGGTSNIISRDAQGNTASNNVLRAATATTSAGATTTLTVASTGVQILTGSANQTYTLPVASTLTVGHIFDFYNESTGTLFIVDSSAAALTEVGQNGSSTVVLRATTPAQGIWEVSNGAPRNANWNASALIYSGVAQLAVGSSAAPTYSFSDSKTTGMYRYATNQLALAANGIDSLIIDATGNITMPNNLTVNGTSTFINSSVVTITDNMILIGYQNATDAVDLGLAIEYTSSGTKYGAVYRGAGTDDWFIKNGIITTPGNTIVGGTLANLNVAQLVCTSFKLTTGASAGYTLTSDAQGNGTWTALGSIVSSLTGTANQVLVNGGVGPATGSITLTLPQSIALTSTPTFGGLTLNSTSTSVALNYSISSSNKIITAYDNTNTYYYVQDPINARTLFTCFSDAVSSHVNLPSGGLVVGAAATVANYAQITTFANGNYTLNEQSITHGIGIYSGTTISDLALFMGADRTNVVSYIQSRVFGTGVGNLIINAQGGNVSVGSAITTSLFNVGSTGQLQINSSGVITAGTWQGTIINPTYGGTGVNNGSLTITLSSGATGKYLASDGSGNASWATLSSASVSSLTGTANQVLVNGVSGTPQTGACILTLPQSIATTSDVQFGRMGLNVAPALGVSYYSANSLSTNFGTITGQAAQYIADTMTLSVAASNAYGIYMQPTILSTVGIVSNSAAGIYIDPLYTSNVGTITNTYGLYIPAGTIHTGTITNSYGAWIATPAYGTTALALYVSGSATISQTAKFPALTASALLCLDASNNVASASVGASLTFTTSTLDTIQAITTSSSPTFNNLTLSGIAINSLIYTNGSNLLSPATINANLTFSAGTLDTAQGIQTSSSPSFAGLTLTGLTQNRILYLNNSFVAASATVSANLSFSSGTLDTVQGIQTTSTPQFAKISANVASSANAVMNIAGNAILGTGTISANSASNNQTYATNVCLGYGVNNPVLYFNATHNSGDKYLSNGHAARIWLDTAIPAIMRFSQAPAGTAGNPITFTEFFTVNTGTSRVGIYKTNPQTTLDVTGTITCSQLINAGLTTNRIVYANASQQLAAVTTSAPLTLTTGTLAVSINATNLQLTANALNTIQNIATVSTPQFAKLGLAVAPSIYVLEAYGNSKFYSTAGGDDGVYMNGTGMPVGLSGVSMGYNQIVNGVAVGNAAYIQAESQGIAYRPILLNPVSGNVGIGLVSPSYLLDVAGTTRSNISLIGASATANSFLSIDDTSSSLNVMMLLNPTLTTSTAATDKYGIINYGRFTYNSGSTSSYATGHYAALNLVVDAGASLINANTLYIAIPAKTGAGTITNAYGIYANTPTVGSTSNVAIYTDNLSCGYAGISPPALGAIISGSVGIGLTGPDRALHVAGVIQISDTSSKAINSVFSNGNGNFLTIEVFNVDNTIKYPICLAPYGGRVGVGTTSPSASYVLDVSGSVRYTTTLYSANAASSSGGCYATDYFNLVFVGGTGANYWNVQTAGASDVFKVYNRTTSGGSEVSTFNNTLDDGSGNATFISMGVKNSSYSVKFIAPTLAGSTTYTLPATDGTNGQYLGTNGSAVLSWNTPLNSTFTSLSGFTSATFTLTTITGSYTVSGNVVSVSLNLELLSSNTGVNLSNFEFTIPYARGSNFADTTSAQGNLTGYVASPTYQLVGIPFSVSGGQKISATIYGSATWNGAYATFVGLNFTYKLN